MSPHQHSDTEDQSDGWLGAFIVLFMMTFLACAAFWSGYAVSRQENHGSILLGCGSDLVNPTLDNVDIIFPENCPETITPVEDPTLTVYSTYYGWGNGEGFHVNRPNPPYFIDIDNQPTPCWLAGSNGELIPLANWNCTIDTSEGIPSRHGN